jgi:hypothetical protein
MLKRNSMTDDELYTFILMRTKKEEEEEEEKLDS